MQRLKVELMGSEVQGVRLYGDPYRQPEPLHFRVCIPGGDVDIVRCTNGGFWVHLRVNHESKRRESLQAGQKVGRIVDARVDHFDKHAGETSPGDINDPAAYHLAARLEVVP